MAMVAAATGQQQQQQCLAEWTSKWFEESLTFILLKALVGSSWMDGGSWRTTTCPWMDGLDGPGGDDGSGGMDGAIHTAEW
uniref:Uncharacterized protein n=1 Tax=Meloidogyne hapla TaxID=6305 RepID=A0A1I8BM71_MELHA